MNTIVTYNPQAKGAYPLLEEMYVERGSQTDWDLLSALHYKSHTLPVGAKHWRLRFRGETIGACVFGMSRPLLKERHALFPLIRPGNDTQISNIARYAYVNDNFRVIGRFVVDTMFRSAGVAYRFANLASRQYGYKFLEIQSSMSKYNMFAERAGFDMVKPIRSMHYEKGLRFMRRYFAAHPADLEALMDEFNLMTPALQSKVERDLKRFYYDHSPLEKTGSRRHYSAGVVDNWGMRRIIAKIQGLCFASPLYGLYRNPDSGRLDIPAQLPLLSFDMQRPNESLKLDLLPEVNGWNDLRRNIALTDALEEEQEPDVHKSKKPNKVKSKSHVISELS